MSTDLLQSITDAAENGKILQESAENVKLLLDRSSSQFYRDVIADLVNQEKWKEIDDRFYTQLKFGTGGLRGRTIGNVVTELERGTPSALDAPEHPCVGTNAMNYFSLSRATQGLVGYVLEYFRDVELPGPRPRIVFSHDTRHFSRQFAEFCAKIVTDLGCDACLFDGPRSTPQLSFAVRTARAQAGVMITASHNPPHDNGYKVYFDDGGQVVEPHASGIISKVQEIQNEDFEPVAESEQGKLHILGSEHDQLYIEKLETLIQSPDLVNAQKEHFRMVFTPIHGTGAIITEPMLKRVGIPYQTVPQQQEQDGRFPTVESPNPENAEALQMAMKKADEVGADLVAASDPDCDRIGIAARGPDGQLHLLTGNQIGSLLCYYRTKTFFDQGVLTPDNVENACLIKTFVTTDLQKAIANHYGLRCVETLTGFKYIGAKLDKYEKQLTPEEQTKYRQLSEEETRRMRLDHSTFFVCGGEESYGYLGADFVHDKDGNMAVLMIAEVAMYARSQDMTLPELMDQLYQHFGYYTEKNGSMYMEGAEGAAKIQRLIRSYAEQPSEELAGIRVVESRNFAEQDFVDIEGDPIPKERMLTFELDGGYRVAVRPSGTEPKIKYYMFGVEQPEPGDSLSVDDLAGAKQRVRGKLDELWSYLQKDADNRLAD